MSKPIIDIQTIKTFCQGALGAMTFGMYHQVVTNKIMEQNNQIMEMKHKQEMEVMEQKIKNLEIQLKSKSWW
jgi:hypothetical protein